MSSRSSPRTLRSPACRHPDLAARSASGGWRAALALIAVTILRFGGDWVSLPPAIPDQAAPVEVASWNLEVFSRPGESTAAFLESATAGADVVALQELQPDAAAAIDADPTLRSRFRYRVLEPRDNVSGSACSAATRSTTRRTRLDPIVQEATLDLGGGRRLAIVHAHPFHAEIATLGASRLPVGLDVATRNADLVAIRRLVDKGIAAGLPTILVGDLNTASSEPAFGRLVNGLRDVHGEVGEGTGWTWRPIRLEFLGLGVLRIDHLIGSPDVIPIGIGETCPNVGDHCLVHAGLAIPD